MNKIILCFLISVLPIGATEEQKDHHHHHKKPASINITIQNQPEPTTPADIKKLKIKVAAVTAIVTTILTGTISFIIAMKKCT
jgi:hypothetical protein